MRIRDPKPQRKEHPKIEKSVIDVQRQGERSIKINFKVETKGIGLIHVYYDGKFIKTFKLNLTQDMEVKLRG